MKRLLVESHPHFGVPVVAIDALSEVTDEFGPTIYEWNTSSGRRLTFMARLAPDSQAGLTVVFPGAKDPAVGLPYFLRFSTLLNSNRSFVLVSDPTLELGADLTLGWFMGDEQFDPMENIEALVRHCLGRLRTTKLLIEGSSGGGFASLRLAAKLPTALALVFSPQTNVFEYENGKFAERATALGFGNATAAELNNQWPGRFDVSSLYSNVPLHGRRIIYVQNSGDTAHVQRQLLPFLQALGFDSISAARRSADRGIEVYMVDQGPGHIRPTPQIWNVFDSLALERLSDDLQDSACNNWMMVDRRGGTPIPLNVSAWRSLGEFDVWRREDRRLCISIRAYGSSPKLLRVFFHGAVDRATVALPFVEPRVDGHEGEVIDLHLTDPSLLKWDSLRVGWFIGDWDHDVQAEIAELISELQRLLGDLPVLLVGASAGGFAALHVAALLGPRVFTLAFAPDTAVYRRNSTHSRAYQQAAFGLPHGDAAAVALSRMNVESLNNRLDPQRTCVLHNVRAPEYLETQIKPLVKAAEEHDVVRLWERIGAKASCPEFGSKDQQPSSALYNAALSRASRKASDDFRRGHAQGLGAGGFAKGEVPVIAYTRMGVGVFDDRWWKYRLSLFESITAPSMAKCIRPGFHWFILLDADIADAHLEELKSILDRDKLTGNVRFIFLDFIADMSQRLTEACREVLTPDSVAIFHPIDDDDAISADFYSNAWLCMAELKESHEYPTVITFPKYLGFNPELGLFAREEYAYHSFNTVIIGSLEEVEPSFFVPHSEKGAWAEKSGGRSHAAMSYEGSSLYTHHGLSDTDYLVRLNEMRERTDSSNALDSLAVRFGIKLDRLQSWQELQNGFPSVHGTTWTRPGGLLREAAETVNERKAIKARLRHAMSSVLEPTLQLSDGARECQRGAAPTTQPRIIFPQAGQTLSAGAILVYGLGPASSGIYIWLNGRIYRKVVTSEVGFWCAEINFGVSSWRIGVTTTPVVSELTTDIEFEASQ